MMGFPKVLVLLVFLGAAFADEEAKGLSFDPSRGTVEGCVIDCSEGGYHQHPTDCTKFVQCTPSGPMALPCPEDTLWDQDSLTCNHDESVTGETGSYLTPDGRPCPEVPEEPTTPATPGRCWFKCPEEHGEFAHPRNCERYFYCVHWFPVPVKCPFGLHFNQRTNRCAIPLLARCQASPDAEC